MIFPPIAAPAPIAAFALFGSPLLAVTTVMAAVDVDVEIGAETVDFTPCALGV